ncbi:MAG: hypothetical protein ABL967_03940 [Bryobacteraceae bacterium]
MSVSCNICNVKKARRHCAAVNAEICPQCCGEQRENTLDCPLDCPHLRDARARERVPELDASQVPNMDVKVSEKFIRDNEPLVFMLALALRRAMQAERAMDTDAREALEAAIKTLRTKESGLIYESRPQNPYAASIQEKLAAAAAEFEAGLAKEIGMTVRDTDVLGSLVFLQRLELQHNNGRRKSRAFLDFLVHYIPEPEKPPILA